MEFKSPPLAAKLQRREEDGALQILYYRNDVTYAFRLPKDAEIPKDVPKIDLCTDERVKFFNFLESLIADPSLLGVATLLNWVDKQLDEASMQLDDVTKDQIIQETKKGNLKKM